MTTSCHLAHGSHEGDIHGCIEALALPDPHRSWIEPRPGSGLDADGAEIPQLAPDKLHPLLRSGGPDMAEEIPIDEARLFWPWGSLYLVDDATGTTRWSFWTEVQSAAFGDAKRALDAVRHNASDCRTEDSLTLEETSVLALRDLKRFGLGEDAATGKLVLRLLRHRGVVIGWTVIG